MALETIISQVRLPGRDGPVDIGFEGGRIAAMEPHLAAEAPRWEARGALAFPGFVEAHIHLDKACILERCAICEGTLGEAIAQTAAAKAAFTTEDVYRRASALLEKAILHGTTRMRTFVEVDPRAGLRSFEALLAVKRDYAFAIDLELCAFAQEGLTQEMETHDLLDRSLAAGADLVGGCPYADPDPERHVALIFDLAQKHGTDVDFHLDFDLDPSGSAIPAVLRETEARGYGGRVSIGHVTKLSAMAPDEVDRIGRRLADAGIAVTALPATDLFLMGRGQDSLIPRGVAPLSRLRALGVTAAVATNNVLNPFTPYGDASLVRMANLFANLAQLSREDELDAAFAMATSEPARMLRVSSYGLEPGGPADLVLLDADTPSAAVREVAPALAGWKAGRQTFERPRPRLLRE